MPPSLGTGGTVRKGQSAPTDLDPIEYRSASVLF